jgi:ribosomal protein S18 acetylase RimI-like enzyme
VAHPFRLRDAKPDDVGALARLIADCNDSYSQWAPPGWRARPASPAHRQRLRERIERAEDWVRVAVDHQRMVGLVSWRASSRKRIAHLSWLFVDPQVWGEGLGGSLLASAQATIAQAGYRQAELWVPEGNRRARALYERQGWCATDARKMHRSLGLVMLRYRLPSMVQGGPSLASQAQRIPCRDVL